jgi:hypothetical protein
MSTGWLGYHSIFQRNRNILSKPIDRGIISNDPLFRDIWLSVAFARDDVSYFPDDFHSLLLDNLEPPGTNDCLVTRYISINRPAATTPLMHCVDTSHSHVLLSVSTLGFIDQLCLEGELHTGTKLIDTQVWYMPKHQKRFFEMLCNHFCFSIRFASRTSAAVGPSQRDRVFGHISVFLSKVINFIFVL